MCKVIVFQNRRSAQEVLYVAKMQFVSIHFEEYNVPAKMDTVVIQKWHASRMSVQVSNSGYFSFNEQTVVSSLHNNLHG